MKCKIKLIVALNEKYYIGKDNKLMWNIPEDLQLFKNKTENKIVVMGRKTYESIGKPLSNRFNVVLSSTTIEYKDNLNSFNDIENLIKWLEELPKGEEVFIIGGKTLYQQFLDKDLVDEMYISHIYNSQKGDVRFPFIDWKQWEIVKKKKYDKFVFKKYKKLLTKVQCYATIFL